MRIHKFYADLFPVQEFAREYQQAYGGDVGWADPDPEALRFWEKAKAKKEKEKREEGEE